MGLSKRLSAYTDVEKIFMAAAANPNGGRVECKSPAAAIGWRQRAYTFRALWQQETEKAYKDQPKMQHLKGTSPWDDFVLRLDGKAVVIGRQQEEVTFVPADGIMPTSYDVQHPANDPVQPLDIPGVEDSNPDFFLPVEALEAAKQMAAQQHIDMTKPSEKKK